MYIRQTADQWTPEPVDTTGDAGQFVSLALDGNDQPYISYHQAAPAPEVRIAHRDGVGWHVEVVDADGEMGGYNSLALGTDGRPRIAYYVGYPYHHLRYAWRDAVGWHREVAFSGGDVGLYPSLVLDGADQPHISFLGYLPDRYAMSLGMAQRVGMGWSIMVGLHTGIDTRPGTSLALDEASLPMVSFSCDGGLCLGRFVRWGKRYLPAVIRLSDSSCSPTARH
jgi:hypothetical protein